MINYRLLSKIFLLFAILTIIGFMRLKIDTDVIHSLPTNNKAIADALDIFENHPIHDEIAIDITLNHDDSGTLVKCADIVEKKLVNSGLFAEVGMAEISSLIPQLAFDVVRNLPLLFSAAELNKSVAPRLSATAITGKVNKIFAALSGMAGIGQAEFIATDPLDLKNLIMAKMAMLAPSKNSRIYQGKILSADGRHLLVTARPLLSGSNTASARKIVKLITDISAQLNARFAKNGYTVTLTPAGAYRAALDNELIIRKDVNRAILLATAGIILLLILSFPRPLIGLMALVPALAGTAAALFVYSLLHPSISIMVLGFGGAIISITVDHGIAYLLFLDCPYETRGKDASREVWAVGIMAVLTTIGAFSILCFSGFPIFVQLGQFAALGVLFSFLFVHLIFPKIFPVMPPAASRVLPLQRVVDKFFNTGRTGAILALIFAAVMLFYAKPEFNTDLSAMNTVSRKTIAADHLFAKVWGNISSKDYLMISAPSISDIRQIDDALLNKITQDRKSGLLAAAFVPSMIFPGAKRQSENFAAWRAFWTPERVREVKNSLLKASEGLGFTPKAFEPFFNLLSLTKQPPGIAFPPRFYSLMGISKAAAKPGLIQFITITPGKSYNMREFLKNYRAYGKIFEPKFFAGELGDLLFSTFTRLFIMIAVGVTLLLFLVFLSWRLTLITLLPVIFAYICTLGTLRIIGHPIDIPGLMLSIIILGMGIDYSIFFVRAYQRYRSVDNPSYGLVRMAVFMSAASTLIGFGALIPARHSLLHSAGLISTLGIGYSLIGAFVLLPPLLKAQFSQKNTTLLNNSNAPGTETIRRRIIKRYKLLEAYPRVFARFKTKIDPMFSDLPAMFKNCPPLKTIVDIGCGYGVPAAWCLEYFPEAKIFGLDPDPERVRITSLVTADRGTIIQGWAPEMPRVTTPVDCILMLDMLHYLDDEVLAAIFRKSGQLLRPGGILIIRYAVIPSGKPSWFWHVEDLRVKFSRMTPHYRTIKEVNDLLLTAGFAVKIHEVSAANDELVWLKAFAAPTPADNHTMNS
ncbi:methyltransferase domain-containing protein [Desulfobacterota bacterium M19]